MSATRRDHAQSDTRHTTVRIQARPGRIARSGAQALAPDTSDQKLAAAMRQNDELLESCSLLTEKVSSLEIALAKANQFAHYDELTGLPNRRLLLDRFIQAAALAIRHRQVLALLFFDVNDFKRVNDNLGHEAGDKLLQLVATRLSGSIRRSDTACRYGGDEFVCLIAEIDHWKGAVKALQKIRTALTPPYVIDRHAIRLTVSDGLAIYPNDAHRFTDLMQVADRSMFSNKVGDRNHSSRVPASTFSLHDAENVLCLNQKK